MTISEIVLDLAAQPPCQVGLVTGYFRWTGTRVKADFAARASLEASFLKTVVGIYKGGSDLAQRIKNVQELAGVHYVTVLPEFGFTDHLDALGADWWIREV